MSDFEDSAMIALLPTDTSWCSIELPHMTLVYAGEIKSLKISDFNALAKDAAAIAAVTTCLLVRVMGVEVFGGGTDDKVDVLTLAPTPELLAIRGLVENWNASEFPFKPHATIGPEGTAPPILPSYLSFNRIMAAWGDDSMTFWLKSPGL